ncbi:2-oxoacid:acceptor oxidoreductase family protein [Fonticella tunisiensis]|uniref:2-oxoacid:acceptor oxidoreductase family protein n=1 Tax=Fonticella tunisiensis TaxID=1096341 RepID=UPI00105F6D3C|nr:2-oxoacid:acceptor oxidoreductase family protein [Fonticella tunisiensis]
MRETLVFKKQVIIGGTGGQGIMLAGIIIGEAAVYDGYHVIQCQNYGPESRGGASRSDIIISDSEIYYPKVQKADIFVSLSQEAFNRYLKYSDASSIIIVDKSIDVGNVAGCKSYGMIEYAYKVLNRPMTINMIAIGIMNSLTGILSQEGIRKAIEKNVPPNTFDVNYSAYNAGYSLLKSL